MLIALPIRTAASPALFSAPSRPLSFAELDQVEQVRMLFSEQFPDVLS